MAEDAPEFEVEITPKMIKAGLTFLEDRGLNSLTSLTAYPEFVVGFIRAVNAATADHGVVKKIRLSGPTLKLLRLLLGSTEGQSGAAITKATGIGSGTLYPLLARLEAAGWIEGVWVEADPPKAVRNRQRFYALTAAGRTEAEAALGEFQISGMW